MRSKRIVPLHVRPAEEAAGWAWVVLGAFVIVAVTAALVWAVSTLAVIL